MLLKLLFYSLSMDVFLITPLMSQIGFCIPCRNTRNLGLFVAPNYNTNNGNYNFFLRAFVLANKISTKLDFVYFLVTY